MGEYANVKSVKFVRFLQKLQNNQRGVELEKAGRHNYKLYCIANGESRPIPSSHREINKNVVKSIMECLVRWGICTTEEFDDGIR